MARLPKEDRAGLLITVIVHLTVIIILLLVQIGRELGRENTFVLDFTREEELEKARKEQDFKDDISRRIDEMLGESPSYSASQIKNIAVDRSTLKDDRNTDADQLYKDAERLAQELKAGQSSEVENAVDEAVDLGRNRTEETGEKKEYKGASVLSYNLDGRKMTVQKVPAYKCMGSGDVTVIIKVNPSGTVIDAKVLESASSSDACLRTHAVRAARTSKFNAKEGTANQIGDITYRFIAQ